MNTKRSFRKLFFQSAIIVAALSMMIFVRAAIAADAAQTDNPSSPAAEALDTKKNAWELYKAGGFFMIPLTACSVLAVALIIERFVALRRRVVIPPKFLDGLKQVLRDPREDREAAIEYCKKHDSAIARMIGAGLRRLPRGWTAAEKGIEDAGANEALKLRRNMRFLYSIGSVATLLGLIGTISGMILAFQNAAASGTGDVHKLSTGIYEAMVNTFGGLAVAIVVTIFYYFFVGRIEKFISELNDALSDFSDEYALRDEPELAA